MSAITRFVALAANTALFVIILGIVITYDPMKAAIDHAVLVAIMSE